MLPTDQREDASRAMSETMVRDEALDKICARPGLRISVGEPGISTRSGLRKNGLIDLTQCAGNCAFMMVPIGAHPFEATALR